MTGNDYEDQYCARLQEATRVIGYTCKHESTQVDPLLRVPQINQAQPDAVANSKLCERLRRGCGAIGGILGPAMMAVICKLVDS